MSEELTSWQMAWIETYNENLVALKAENERLKRNNEDLEDIRKDLLNEQCEGEQCELFQKFNDLQSLNLRMGEELKKILYKANHCVLCNHAGCIVPTGEQTLRHAADCSLGKMLEELKGDVK